MVKRKQFRGSLGPGLRVSMVVIILCGALLPAAAGEAGKEDTRGEMSAREKRLLERQRERENQKAELEWTNAESSFLVNDFEAARKTYMAIVRQYPSSDYALRSMVRIGDVYRAEKAFQQAIDFYRKVLTSYSKLEREQQERLKEELIRARYLIGATYYDQRNYRQAFGELRAFIRDFADSKYANVAYFLIGQGHLANNNFRAAIEAFESVGTAQAEDDQAGRTVISPNDTLYIRVADPDMRTAAVGQMVKVALRTSSGDMETLLLKPKGIGSDLFVGTIKTRLGGPDPTAPLENLWSVEVDKELDRALRTAAELEKRVVELREKRESARREMQRISKDDSLSGKEQLEAVDKQKEIVSDLSKSIMDCQTRAKTGREMTFSRLDAVYAGIERFLERRAPDQTIKAIQQRMEERLAELKAAEEEEQVEEEQPEEEEAEKAKSEEKEAFSEEEILEVRVSVQEEPTSPAGFERRRAVLRYWVERLLHDLKRIEVVGTDKIEVLYKDDHVTSGHGPIIRKDIIGLAADGFVGFASEDLKSMVVKAVYSSDVCVQVIDPDQDVGNAKDNVEVVLSVVPREKPEEKEEKEEAAASAEEEPGERQTYGGRPRYIETYAPEAQYKVLETKSAEGTTEKVIVEVEAEANPPLIPENVPHATVTLTETSPHSGVFVAMIPGTPRGIMAGDTELVVSTEERLRAAYEDERNIARRKPWVVWSVVDFVPPGEGEVEVPEKIDTKLNRRAQLEKGISEAELAKVYEDLGLKDMATLYFEKALRTCASVARAERLSRGLTPLGEEATHAIWRIYFESGQTEKAISACKQLIREFPESNLVDEAYLVMGQAMIKRAEEADVRRRGGYAREAVAAFNGLLRARPKSDYVPEAIYSIGLAMYIAGEGGSTYMERVVKNYPESSFAARALEKSGTYAFMNGDYAGAYEYFTRIVADYPDAKDLDKVLFARGHCKVKMRNYPDALRAYYELTETYPGSPYAKKAQKVIEYLKKAMAKAEAE